MDKPLIVGTGLSGLMGSRIVELLENKYSFLNFSLETNIDITDKVQLADHLKNLRPQLVLHMAAVTDVDACEKEKDLGEKSLAWKVNVVGTMNLVHYCQANAVPMIYISTDYVFGKGQGEYSESDSPKPINFYGRTKLEAEKLVLTLGKLATVCRPSFPYRAKFPLKIDLVRAILNRLVLGKPVYAITDQIIVPTLIDDIAFALDLLITEQKTGIFHVVGSESIKPFDLARKIAETFDFKSELIVPTTRAVYYRGRAYRPFKTTLRNDKIRVLGANMRNVSDGLLELKKQLSFSKNKKL